MQNNTSTLKNLATVCRILLGLTFIFSGFVKTVDPWGTAIKISEYLNAFGFEDLKYYRFGFAIWLCGAELMMGCMLLFKVRTPLISIFAVVAMVIFTSITFVSAVWLPVEDCGPCGGDAAASFPTGGTGSSSRCFSSCPIHSSASSGAGHCGSSAERIRLGHSLLRKILGTNPIGFRRIIRQSASPLPSTPTAAA